MFAKYGIVMVIILAVGCGASFYVGMHYEKNSLQKQGLIRSFDGTQRNRPDRGSGTAGGARFGIGSNGGFVTGNVIAKDDTSITIGTRDGGSRILYFSDLTTVGRAVPGSLDDVKVGAQITANGKTNQDGSFSAEQIQLRPE